MLDEVFFDNKKESKNFFNIKMLVKIISSPLSFVRNLQCALTLESRASIDFFGIKGGGGYFLVTSGVTRRKQT